ncbi:hypothetical protein SAMN02745116_00291 [Pilibacter termitis]|uniref:ABC-2 type transport system permease protein n=1 Tax=Pilibacter termitis TaxID=263852 RepID=A0A1T4KM36_9ENTE|nr:hypothetical protein [Pilibacter termitis]SJZ43450.1 hypothetical protein SAMN02745116_00291 [Pilibacter termitis]
MIQRLKFEWKSFLVMKNALLLCLLLVLFLFNFSTLSFTQEDMMSNYIGSLDQEIRIYSINLEKEKKLAKESGNEVGLENLKWKDETLDLMNHQITALRRGDWNEYYILQYKKNNLSSNNGVKKNLEELRERDPKLYLQLKKDDALIARFVEKKIPITEDIMHPLTAWGTLEDTLKFASNFIVIMLFSILFCDFLTNNFEKSTIYLYSFTRKKKRTIIDSKLFVQFFSTAIFLIFSLGLLIVSKAMINGFGTSKFPVVIGNDIYRLDFSYISAPELVISYVPYYFVVLLFLGILFLFLGAYLKKTLLSLGVFLVSYYGFTLIKDSEMMKTFSPFIPYSYLDVYGVITQTDLYFPRASFLIGIIYLLTLSVFFYALTVRKMNKLEI